MRKQIIIFVCVLFLLFSACATASLRVFASEENSFTYTPTEIQDLNMPEDFAYFDKAFYLTDSYLNKVLHFNLHDGAATTLVNPYSTVKDGTVNHPAAITGDKFGNFAVSDNFARIQVFNVNGEYCEQYEWFYPTETPIAIAHICEVKYSLSGKLYAIDDYWNILLYKPNESARFTVLADLTGLGFTATAESRISITFDEETIFISNADEIIALNNDGTTSPYSVDYSGITGITDIGIDHNNNLYILAAGTVYKHTLSINSYQNRLNYTNVVLNNAKALELDIENGIGYVLTNDEILSFSGKLNGVNFFDSIADVPPPVVIEELTSLNAPAPILITTAQTVLYRYPNYFSVLTTVDEGVKIVSLYQNVPVNPLFHYVLIVSLGEENIAGYIPASGITEAADTEPPFVNAKILLNNTRVFKYPTTLNCNDSELTIATLNANIFITLLGCASNITDYLNNTFYLIEFDGGYGYVDRLSVQNSSSEFSTPAFVPNAHIINTAVIYTDAAKTPSQYTLNKNYKVKITGKIGKLYIIEFLTENSIVEGYVDAALVDDGSLKPLQIVSIILILIILIGLVLILIFAFKPKRQ